MTTESLITRTPENTSFLQTTKYTFFIPELSFAKYFCQSVSLPGVATSAVKVETPFTATFRHGDKLVFEPFAIRVLIDEDLRVWEETLNWLTSLTKPTEFAQYNKRNSVLKELYYDGVLTINTNSNQPNIRVKFKNVHPVSLSGINFDNKNTADQVATCDISFRYDYFEIDRLTS
jgi:hypothetical protein